MDSASVKPAIERLSFDILGEIFQQYLETETISYPLETLLLVCRTWHGALLEHRALWGQLKIYIGHEPASKFWMKRLPRRLDRSGLTVPLSIDIRNLHGLPIHKQAELIKIAYGEKFKCKQSPCNCASKASIAVRCILHMLAGQNGEICGRWKTVHLELGESTYVRERSRGAIARDLSHPTPLLSSFSFVAFEYEPSSNNQFLPFCPCLEEYSISCESQIFGPNLSSAHSINFSLKSPASPSNDSGILTTAHRVRRLALTGVGRNVSLPEELPNLWSLGLNANSIPTNITQIKAPGLRQIFLYENGLDGLEAILQNKTLPWSEMELVCCVLCCGLEEFVQRAPPLIKNLLSSCCKLEVFFGHSKELAVCLKLFWETNGDIASTLHQRSVGKNIGFMDYSNFLHAKLDFPTNRQNIEAAAKDMKLPSPNLSWKQLHEKIKRG